MAEALSYETLQKQIAESELGREWVQDALMRQDVWLLTDLGYSQSECEIRRLNKLYFQDFSFPWLKLLAKLTARARARERHSLDWVHRQVRSLYQLECFMTSQGYFQPEDLSNKLLQQFIVSHNGVNHRYSIAYAIQLWKEEGWLNLQFIPPKRNRKTPEIKSIPEEVLHQIYDSFDSLPPMLERMFRLQLALGRRITEVLTLPRNCLKREQERWFSLLYPSQQKQWQFQCIHPLVAEIVREQQKFITAQFGVNTDFNYLFCHFQGTDYRSYPEFSEMKALPYPRFGKPRNQMVKIIRLLIKREGILDANGQRPHFTGKITRPSRLQEIRVKYGVKAAQLYADHKKSEVTLQHYVPPTQEQISQADLPIQKLLMNPDNKFLPWQSLPESLLKNPKAHELDLEIAPRLVVYGHCALDPKTPCPVNLFPKCYGCSSFRPSTGKLSLYERQYQGEQQRLLEAEKVGAELAQEEAKATIEAMDKWLPELRRLANG